MKASVSSLIGINGCHDVFMTDLHAAKKHISNWEKMNTIRKYPRDFLGIKPIQLLSGLMNIVLLK